MRQRKRWILLLPLLSLILGCNSVEGMQGVREKAEQEGKRVLERIDGYAQQAEISARRVERAGFCYLIKILPKNVSNPPDRGRRAQK